MRAVINRPREVAFRARTLRSLQTVKKPFTADLQSGRAAKTGIVGFQGFGLYA